MVREWVDGWIDRYWVLVFLSYSLCVYFRTSRSPLPQVHSTVSLPRSTLWSAKHWPAWMNPWKWQRRGPMAAMSTPRHSWHMRLPWLGTRIRGKKYWNHLMRKLWKKVGIFAKIFLSTHFQWEVKEKWIPENNFPFWFAPLWNSKISKTAPPLPRWVFLLYSRFFPEIFCYVIYQPSCHWCNIHETCNLEEKRFNPVQDLGCQVSLQQAPRKKYHGRRARWSKGPQLMAAEQKSREIREEGLKDHMQ